MKLDQQELREIREFERKAGVNFDGIVLQESLPTSYGKDGKPVEHAHARVVAAFSGERLIGVTPLSTIIDEAPRDAKVVIPSGTHKKLAEAIGESAPVVTETLRKKLAAAL